MTEFKDTIAALRGLASMRAHDAKYEHSSAAARFSATVGREYALVAEVLERFPVEFGHLADMCHTEKKFESLQQELDLLEKP